MKYASGVVMAGTAVIGERGQVTIPKNIRDHLGLKPHDPLTIEMENDKVVIEKPISKKETERLIKEYYSEHYDFEKKVAKEWAHVSKEADAMLDEY
ncbi:MAG: AbrB/MazE/SpoVT family DNA-binding domain-containing protein [DPANN group archaeon]|nr:AbrB/MazE/SpoVT family DNA-binding domain-containing protein [DPANN group archaeon]